MTESSAPRPRKPFSQIAELGGVPDCGTREAVVHLARLANAKPRFDGAPLTGKLIWLAQRLNDRLPPELQVPIEELEDAPPIGGDPELVAQFAVSTIGAYVANPAATPTLAARQKSYIALERYLVWCRGLWKAVEASRPIVDAFHFDPEVTSPQDDIGEHALGAVLHWLASLCVVIEGWEELELTDAAVDDLLRQGGDPRTPGTLRHRLQRFRNGVFHYQPMGTEDPRFKDFWEDQVIQWAVPLERAFERFFREAWESQQATLDAWLHRGLVQYDPDLSP